MGVLFHLKVSFVMDLKEIPAFQKKRALFEQAVLCVLCLLDCQEFYILRLLFKKNFTEDSDPMKNACDAPLGAGYVLRPQIIS